MILDVYVQDQKVGVLERTGITSFVFTYLPQVPPELSVSIGRKQRWRL